MVPIPVSPTSQSQRINSFGGEARLLSHNLSGYLTCKIISSFCSLPPMKAERVRLIAVSHNYDELLKEQNGVTVSIARNFLLPLLSKHLPSLIETKLIQIGQLAETQAKFPAKLLDDTLKRVVAFYDDVDLVARQVAREPVLKTTIDNTMAEALEHLSEKNGLSEEQLFSLSSQKIIQEVVAAALLDKTPALLYWPTSFVLQSIQWSLQFTIGPIVRLAKANIPSDGGSSDELLNRLIVPTNILACRFLRQLKTQLEKEGRRSSSPRSGAPHLGIDRELMKRYLKKEAYVTQIGDCVSQEQLDRIFKGSFIQDRLNWIQDRYGLEETAKVIEEIIDSSWKIAKDPAWRKRELFLFYQSMNHTFQEPQRLLGQPDDVGRATDELVKVVLKTKFDGLFRQNDKVYDVTSQINRYFGINIKKTLLKHITPLAIYAEKQTSESFTRFWSKRYSLRFGLLHKQLLHRWINK